MSKKDGTIDLATPSHFDVTKSSTPRSPSAGINRHPDPLFSGTVISRDLREENGVLYPYLKRDVGKRRGKQLKVLVQPAESPDYLTSSARGIRLATAKTTRKRPSSGKYGSPLLPITAATILAARKTIKLYG